ncbi:DUF305 domain-containing protein [Streptomyces sp. NPDC051322]|uniref:DUF305 domain-containing protein n=1 Tax=Streptomyces sp. NPDC051322 TaxID=3154645 RepID=UPI0034502B95
MTAHRSLGRTAGVVATAAAAVLLAACGSDDGSSGHHAPGHDKSSTSSTPSVSASDSQGAHNAQDVAFAQGMIPHHRQAVVMADLAPSRAKSQAVTDLAATIKKAQDPEITTMSGWLKTWGRNVPTGDMPSMSGMAHSGGGMDGMMPEADMTKLEKLSGPAFDTAFLQMMIGHHQGAVDMAKTEQSKGAYGPAETLAKSIIMSQSAEIARMNKMLGK